MRMGKKAKEKPLTRKQWLKMEALEKRALGVMGSPLGSSNATRAVGVDEKAAKGVAYQQRSKNSK
jgi:hypothetical protein